MSVQIITGDCRTELAKLADESVNCVVTSPPYWGLRDYGVDGAIGLEASITEHITALREVFREVRRVVRKDGTCWVNYGDAYCSIGHKKAGSGYGTTGLAGGKAQEHTPLKRENNASDIGLKHKDLMGLPWRLAFALQDDGWWLRQDIIWSKPNPMPEPVRDRCTKAHEYIFLLSKSQRYFYDADAIRTELAAKTLTTFGTERKALGNDALGGVKADNFGKSLPIRKPRMKIPGGWDRGAGGHGTIHRDGRGAPEYQEVELAGANARSVWEIATSPFPEAHFATFPPELAERCIKAGCPEGGIVLDPFGGAGTTGMVADRLRRNAILIELNPAYAEIARNRIAKDAGMFAELSA